MIKRIVAWFYKKGGSFSLVSPLASGTTGVGGEDLVVGVADTRKNGTGQVSSISLYARFGGHRLLGGGGHYGAAAVNMCTRAVEFCTYAGFETLRRYIWRWFMIVVWQPG